MPSIQDIHRYAPHTISNFKTKQPGEPQLYYELHGTGKNKMLLVTGLSSNCVSWEATINFFLPGYRTTEEVEDEYEICIFDNRCVGDSETLSNGFKVKDMALDAMDLLRHLGWTKNVFLAGVSMGGMISLELALLAPKDTFAKVCFISTHAGRTIPPLKSAFSLLNILFKKGKIPDSERVRLLVQLIFSPTWLALRPNEEEVRIFQRQIVGDVSTHPDIEIKSLEDYKTNLDAVADMLTRHGNTKPTQTEAGRKAQIMAINSHYVSKERLRELGKAMEGNILIVTGTDDPLIRPKNSDHIAKHTGGKLIVYPAKGHALFFEAYTKFHTDMADHFRASPHFIATTTTKTTATTEVAPSSVTENVAAPVEVNEVVEEGREALLKAAEEEMMEEKKMEAEVVGETVAHPPPVAVAAA